MKMPTLSSLMSRIGLGGRSSVEVNQTTANSSVSVQAATVIATPETPKVKNKQQVLPSHLRTAQPNPKSRLQISDRNTANLDLTTLRTQTSTRETIRQFIKTHPDLSGAVKSYIRMAITDGYVGVAKNLDGTFNPEATAVLQQVLTWMNILSDYSIGYDDAPSVRSLCETWGLDLLTYGEMCGELVLNKARLPDKIQPVSASQITRYPSSDGKRMIPHQELAGENIELDIPTFFSVALDQDALSAYPDPPLESALQSVLFSSDFMNDIRRIVKRAIHPRLDVVLNVEKFQQMLPKEVLNDADKLREAINQTIADVTNLVNSLEPEDAMVHFDSIGIEIVDHGNTNLSNEYQVIQDMQDAKMATGAKVMPTVLGKSSGTSNVASAEVLMFMKYVEGTLWSKLNEMLSKILTLAVRLLGHDVYVEFKFNKIDLRPDSELESFRALKQSRILELLSLGLMTDEAASLELTGGLPPAGAPKLSGTNFFNAKAASPAGDGYNGASNNGSTQNQNNRSDAPTGGARGQNKKAEIVNLGSRA